MKNNFLILILAAAGILLVACSDGNNGRTGFNPVDRTTVDMTAAERDAAVSALKQADAFVDSMLYTNNVKMSVLPPASEALDANQTEAMAVKMLQMLAENGIGGLNTVPGFAMTATVTSVKTDATSTAPQKFMTDFDVTYSVINTINGDVYATATQKLQGVGASREQATDNAIAAITPATETARMLSTASVKIINWYDTNLGTFKGQVSAAEAKADYALALTLIQSVPEHATAAFAYAESRRADIEAKFLRQISDSEYSAMKQAITESDSRPSADVYAHYAMIPATAPCYADATKALEKYEADVAAKRTADTEQQLAEAAAERQQQLELAKLESSRIKAKYKAQASEQAIRLYLSQNSSTRGFWSNLGARIIGAIDGTNWQFRVKDRPYTED